MVASPRLSADRFRTSYQVDFAGGEWFFAAMDKKRTAIHRMTDHHNDDCFPGTPEERIRLVWPLTREVASLSVKHDAERRLQRQVACLIR